MRWTCRHGCTRWQSILADPTRATLLAEVDGALAGVRPVRAAGRRDVRQGAARSRICSSGRTFARRGIGRRLMAQMAAILQARGHAGIGLGVVVGNTPAIAFYEAMGGRKIGAYTDPGPMWRSDNLLLCLGRSRGADRPRASARKYSTCRHGADSAWWGSCAHQYSALTERNSDLDAQDSRYGRPRLALRIAPMVVLDQVARRIRRPAFSALGGRWRRGSGRASHC